MATSARKPADAATPDGEPSSVPEGPASQTPMAQEAPAVAEFRPAESVVFVGQAQSAVAGVGLCDPGDAYPVSAVLADALCGGTSPQFIRAKNA